MSTSTAGPPGGPFVLTLSCPDRPGIVQRRHRIPGRARRQHPREPAVRRPRDRPLLHADRRSRSPTAASDAEHAARRPSPPIAEAVRHELRAVGGPGAVPHADHGLQAAALPQRPAVPARAPARCRSRSRRSSPTTPTPSRWRGTTASPFHHIPVTPDTKPEAEAELLELVDELGIDLVVLARYMQVLSDDLCRHARGAGDQHPPLVPAELQGRQALPPGASTAA